MTDTIAAPDASAPPTTRHVDEHDRLHREDGPAVMHASGTREWWRHGLLHREGGPPIEYADGRVAHWLHGRQNVCPRTQQR